MYSQLNCPGLYFSKKYTIHISILLVLHKNKNLLKASGPSKNYQIDHQNLLSEGTDRRLVLHLFFVVPYFCSVTWSKELLFYGSLVLFMFFEKPLVPVVLGRTMFEVRCSIVRSQK